MGELVGTTVRSLSRSYSKALTMDHFLPLSKEEKQEPSGRDQQTYLCTELGIPEEELRNLSSEGGFTARHLNIM